jgi:hypothetical protein
MEELEAITQRIFVIRGERVMLDADLAALYGVTAKRFNEQVRRNIERFPSDFMFRLTNQEVINLRSPIATSSWGGRRYAPFVFTEHGAIMAATILNAPRAVEVAVHVVRAFVRMREALAASRELTKRLNELERRVGTHDRAIGEILAAIRQLAAPPDPPDPPPRRRIGFVQAGSLGGSSCGDVSCGASSFGGYFFTPCFSSHQIASPVSVTLITMPRMRKKLEGPPPPEPMSHHQSAADHDAQESEVGEVAERMGEQQPAAPGDLGHLASHASATSPAMPANACSNGFMACAVALQSGKIEAIVVWIACAAARGSGASRTGRPTTM